jgi:nuclear pore complex protein Nup98-Nup96
MSEDEIAFHHSFKPRWGHMDALVFATDGMRGSYSDLSPWEQRFSVTSEGRDINVLSFNKSWEVGFFFF